MRAALPTLLFCACAACSDSGTAPADGAVEAAPDAGVADTGEGGDAGPPPGDSGPVKCNTPSDCPDPSEMVCDPMTRTCAFDECGPTSGKTCGAGQVCVYQQQGSTSGACYAACSPFATAPDAGVLVCPANQECVIGKWDGTVGYCKPSGGGATGSKCLPSSVETGCVAGDVCALDPKVRYCREQCDFWTGLHDCSSLSCTPPGICTGDTADPAAVGAACNSPAGTLCGASGKRLLGWCVGQMPIVCRAWCRTSGSDCPMNQTCQPTNVPSVGYCQ